MKKIFFILSLVVASFTQSFANDTKVSAIVIKEFEFRFNRAKDVSWSQEGEFTIASFTQYGKKLFAYFNNSGELIVVAEPVTLQMLPQALFTNLVEEHSTSAITEVYKMKNDEGTRYYAVIENQKEKTFLNSNGEEWTVAKKVKKQ